jgi:hypothetical protein
MAMNRGSMSQQIGKPTMKKTKKKYMGGGPVAYKKGGKVKAGKSDQMQSSPRKQMAMKGMK